MKQSTLPSKLVLTSALAGLALGAGVFGTALLGGGVSPAQAEVQFKHALDDSDLDVSPVEGETFTDEVKEFHETGENPYDGNEEAIAEGKKLYDANCQVCHGATGGGGMGLNLVDDDVAYPRVATDVGMFEVIHSGASGAMRSFAQRGMHQDDMLKIIAYVHSLKK